MPKKKLSQDSTPDYEKIGIISSSAPSVGVTVGRRDNRYPEISGKNLLLIAKWFRIFHPKALLSEIQERMIERGEW